MQVKADNQFFVTVFAPNGVVSGYLGFSDGEAAKKHAAQQIAAAKGGTAVVFERVASCQLPTPAVEWSEVKK